MNKTSVLVAALVVLGLLGTAALAEGCVSTSCQDDLTCAPSATGDGSADGMSDRVMPSDADVKSDGAKDGGSEADSMKCDLTAPPSKDNCVLQDGNGIFVASPPYGSDGSSGKGTIEAPFATIQNALNHLGGPHRIYVCNGSYSDKITVDAGVGIFGGLTCASHKWAYAPGTTAQVTGTSPDFVLKINSVSDTVDIEDMEFDSPDAGMAGQSSIAAWVISSPSVTMHRTTLQAGAGVTGTSGSAGGAGVPTPATLTGNNADTTDPGPECSISCSSGGVSTGGTGGTVALSGNGAAGTVAQSPSNPSGATGAGGTESACSSTSPTGGTDGSNAVPAVASDGSGAPAGTLDAMGWHPGSGQVGPSGSPGQGGGGGGSVVAGWGGGGGCGGCGGFGGGFGTGGGASVALVAFASPVTLASCTLTSGTAGNGGTGAGGGAGQAGGARGTGSGSGCNGGNGGAGSQGGAGGGGAAGISVGVLYSGSASAPIFMGSMSVSPGSAGSAGTGGDPGVNDGSAGVSAMTQDATML